MKMFILAGDGRTPVEVTDAEYSIWCVSNGMKYPCVADVGVSPGVRVLTQFLGTDPHGDQDRPKLFETRVCGGEYDGYTLRTSTWDGAERCNRKTVSWAELRIIGRVEPSDFTQKIDAGLLMRWGFTPNDSGEEYERTIRPCNDATGRAGLLLVVHPFDGAACLIEYAKDGKTLRNIALNNLKTIGGVMRLVNALKGELS